MKAILRFFAVFAGILLLSAFLAPLLYKFLPYKFERIFNRLVMIFSLAAVFIAVRRGSFSFPREALRLTPSARRLFAASFALGFFTLTAITFIKLGLGVIEWNIAAKTAPAWMYWVLLSVFSALLIGVIEETFFRGFVFASLREKLKWTLPASLLVTNVFYSLIHFIAARKPFIDDTPEFTDSLKLIYTPLLSLLEWQKILPGAAGLFIFGCILSLAYLRSRSLLPCIGLHAGCVFFLKMDGFFWRQNTHSLWLGSSKNYDGVIGWFFLVLMGLIIARLIRSQTAVRASALCLLIFMNAIHPVSAASSWDVYFEESEAEKKSGILSSKEKKSASPLTPVSDTEKQSEAGYEIPSKPQPDPEIIEPLPPEKDADFLNVGGAKQEPVSVVQDEEAMPAAPMKTPGALPEAFEKPAEREIGAADSSADDQNILSESAESSAAGVISSSEERIDPIDEAALPAPKTDLRAEENDVVEGDRGAPDEGRLDALESSAEVFSGEGYDFAHHLPEATAYQWKDGTPPIKGVWNKNAVLFPGTDEGSQIKLIDSDGQAGPAILFSSLPGATRRLIFTGVPSVSRLRIRYGVPSGVSSNLSNTAAYARIWIGRYPVARLSLSPDSSFKEVILDTGIVSFLNNPVTVTLDLSSGTGDPIPFLFKIQAE